MRTRLIKTDGLVQQVLEAGFETDNAPLVLLIHGFPELGVSWRAQVQALGEAGCHVVAPDMRGYGGTEKPEGVAAYSILNLVGDMVDLVQALGSQSCVVVGHDWGAPVAWHCALLRPDVFTAVVGLSVPFQPRRPKGPPTAAMAAISRRAGLGDLYINRFQDPDAHRALDADPAVALRKLFYAYDGATPAEKRATGFLPEGVDLLGAIDDGATLPPWMSARHFADYVKAFSAGGFDGPLNWYRALDLNWRQTPFVQDQRITPPALFVVGENDPVRHYAGSAEAGLKDWVPNLTRSVVVPGAGHWIQQERADAVNALLLSFLGGLQAAKA
ncbi:alpha/beta fold hydrolase [Brevundimonas sp. SORGH_AS_0993]|uniref:alpha/beta fold hydrolase n=1 Tax=Brevundimonas sp. SORGH_AS_0993 TaxID=3041794 RepID=UPI00278A3489|nr:alpha/beta hydrolase [Brevundimonas sp. SORGH_AS_0993]MDQ1154715.1 pimeloyl-ACP methyl ester carboxylesterase [Brevundimonas sp. SORGH_AS_0993]